MKGNVRKWLVGLGIVTAGATLAEILRHMTSRRLVRLAMDRECPKNVDKEIYKVSGGWEDIGLTERIIRAKQLLEEKVHENIRIESHDGLPLVGHWYPCERPKRILIAMHGWRSSWARDFGLVADFWHDNGCSVLFAEQRGQGESGGEYIGFGMLERHDCLKWAQWANENNAGKLPIYLVGLSMGATTVLMAGGMDLPEGVRGIVADCGFTSAHDIWKHVAKDNLHLHYGLYAAAADDLCKKRIQIGSREYSTLDALAECEVPVLFIHGTDDSFVPIAMTYENYKACAAPKELLVVPGAEHALSYCTEKALYEKTVLAFWRAYDRGNK